MPNACSNKIHIHIHLTLIFIYTYLSMAFWWFAINFLCDYMRNRNKTLAANFRCSPPFKRKTRREMFTAHTKNLLFIKSKNMSCFFHFHQSLMCVLPLLMIHAILLKFVEIFKRKRDENQHKKNPFQY